MTGNDPRSKTDVLDAARGGRLHVAGTGGASLTPGGADSFGAPRPVPAGLLAELAAGPAPLLTWDRNPVQPHWPVCWELTAAGMQEVARLGGDPVVERRDCDDGLAQKGEPR